MFWLCVSSAILGIAHFAHALLLPLYLANAGMRPDRIGFVIGVLSLSLVAARLLGGRLVERTSSRALLLWSSALFSVVAPLPAVTGEFALLVLIRVLQGLTLAFFTSAAIGYVSTAFPARRRGTMLALWWMAWSASVVAGPLLGGLTRAALGDRLALLVTGCGAVLALAPVALTRAVRMEPPVRPGIGGSWRETLEPGLTGAAIGFAGGGLFAYIPLQAHASGLPRPGVYLALLGAGVMLGQFILGRLSDLRSRLSSVMIGAGVAAASIAAMADGTMQGATVLLAGFGTSGLSPVLTAWAVDRTSRSHAVAASTSVAFREIGSFAGAAGVGALLARPAGPRAACTAMVLMAVVALLLTLYAAARDRRAGVPPIPG